MSAESVDPEDAEQAFEHTSLRSMIIARTEELTSPINESRPFAGVQSSATFRLADGGALHLLVEDLVVFDPEVNMRFISPLEQGSDGLAHFVEVAYEINDYEAERLFLKGNETNMWPNRYPAFLYENYLRRLNEQQILLRQAALQAFRVTQDIESLAKPTPTSEEEAAIYAADDSEDALEEWYLGQLTKDFSWLFTPEWITLSKEIADQRDSEDVTPSAAELSERLALLDNLTSNMRVEHDF